MASGRLAGSWDEAENLLGLLHGVVAGIDDLNARAKFSGDRLGRCRLFELVIVIFCNQGNQNFEFVHRAAHFTGLRTGDGTALLGLLNAP